MVVFVDLDRDDNANANTYALEHHRSALPLEKPFPPKLMVASVHTADSTEFQQPSMSSERLSPRKEENPNRNAFSAALSCYP